MIGYIPNNTQGLLSLSWDRVADSIAESGMANAASQFLGTELTLIPCTLLMMEQKPIHVIYDEVYSLIKMDLNEKFECKVNSTVQGISLYTREFEGCRLKSIQANLEGFVLIYNGGRNMVELEKGIVYNSISAAPPFYICLKNKLDPAWISDVKVIIGYMATLPPTEPGTTPSSFMAWMDDNDFREID